MPTICERTDAGETLISDGAWGTFLQREGLQPGECPELWNAEHPDVVKTIAQSYVDAGADLVETNSFGGNRFKLAHFGLTDRVAELNARAVELSLEAADSRAIVLASVGPTGKLLLMGDVSEQQLYDAFAEQVVAMEQAGATACCIETMSAIDEAILAIKAAKENTKLEIAATFTFERTRQGDYRTMMGVSPTEMAAAVVEAGANIIGTNCGNGMERMLDIVRELRECSPNAPLLVHANAGMPVVIDGAQIFPETPEMMASWVQQLVEAGANIIGGCCGTGPEHIRALKEALEQVPA